MYIGLATQPGRWYIFSLFILLSTIMLVPAVHWDLCTRETMVMERMSGIPISQVDRLTEHGIDIPRLARAGVEEARRTLHDVVILDTAGRLHIDDNLMQELERQKQLFARNYISEAALQRAAGRADAFVPVQQPISAVGSPSRSSTSAPAGRVPRSSLATSRPRHEPIS